MTIVEDTRAIAGGVDTHADVHVAAALDRIGGLLGVPEFPAAPAGYASLLGWLRGFGDVAVVGVEGTGSCRQSATADTNSFRSGLALITAAAPVPG
jgi:transposase